MQKHIKNQFASKILTGFVERFGGSNRKPKLLSEVENFVYEIPQNAEPFILRVTHKSHRSHEAISAELDWIQHLLFNGVRAAKPLRSTTGRLIETSRNSDFFATAFHKINGANIIDAGACEPETYKQWGSILGRMHVLSKGFQIKDGSSRRHDWFENEAVINAKRYLKGQNRILDKLNELVSYCHNLPVDQENFGLCHTDFTDVNFFVHDKKITLFDFDDCEYHWFIYDIAVILFDSLAWLPRDEMTEREFGAFFWHHFWEGYSQENNLDGHWLERLPIFMKLREIMLYIFFHRKWDLKNLTNKQKSVMGQFKSNILDDVQSPFLAGIVED